MPRTRYRIEAKTKDATTGVESVIPAPTFAVYQAGTTTPTLQTLYADTTGVGTLPNPFTSGDANGVGTFYLDRQETVDVLVSKTGYTSYTLEEEAGEPPDRARRLAFDIRDYGAKWDGTTDDSAAVAAAITAAGAAKGIVQFPSGTGLALISFTAKPDIWLRGAGRGVTTIKCPPGVTVGTDYVIKCISSDRVVISDLTVHGNRSGNLGNDAQEGISITNSQHVIVERCRVTNVIFLGLTQHGATACTFRDNLLDDIGIQGAATTVRPGHFADGTAIWLGGGTTHPLVLDNVILSPGGSAIQADAAYALIRGNVCLLTGRDYDAGAIYCYTQYGIRVLGNIIIGATGAGIDSVPGTHASNQYGHVYSGNTIIGSLNVGILANLNGTAVSGNTIIDNGDAAASAPSAQGPNPQPNPATGPSTPVYRCGVVVNGRYITVSGNTIGDSRPAGSRTQLHAILLASYDYGIGIPYTPTTYTAECAIVGNNLGSNGATDGTDGIGLYPGFTEAQVGLTGGVARGFATDNTHTIAGNLYGNYERLSVRSTNLNVTPSLRIENTGVNVGVAGSAAELTVQGRTSANAIVSALLDASSLGVRLGSFSAHALALYANSVKALNVDTTGAITSPTQPRSRVFNAANANHPTSATWATLTFDSERYDVAATHSTASNTGRFTAPVAGVYRLGGNASFNANATGNRGVRLLLNGATPIAQVMVPACNGVNTDLNVSTEYQLAAGDYVELQAYQSSGGALALPVTSNASNEFWGRLVA